MPNAMRTFACLQKGSAIHEAARRHTLTPFRKGRTRALSLWILKTTRLRLISWKCLKFTLTPKRLDLHNYAASLAVYENIP